MDQVIKSFDIKTELIEGSREVISIISTDTIDRDGEIVVPKGMKKKNFAGNPVVLLNHNRDGLPVGVNRWIKADGNKLIAKTYITDKTQLGQDIWGLLQDGILGAVSIGFIPELAGPPSEKEIKANPTWSNARRVIRSWDLLEYSFVTVPCNPEALTLAVSKGYSPEVLNWLAEGKELPVIKEKEVDPWQYKNAVVIPEPKFCRSLSSKFNAKLSETLNSIQTRDLLKKYSGRI